MSTPTPGPWKVWRDPADNSINVSSVDGSFVCLVGRSPDRDQERERIEADAHLIKTAPFVPDLVREAKQALAFLEDLEASDNQATRPGSVQAPLFHMLVGSLRDVIVKATRQA